MTYYHITLLSKLDSIMERGLLPMLGERSLEIQEHKKQVFLFPTIEDMENAMIGWLGDWYTEHYGEDTPLALLEISVNSDFPIKKGQVDYEVVSEVTIPPQYIKFIRIE